MCIIVWRERRKPFFFCFVRLVRLVRLLAACRISRGRSRPDAALSFSPLRLVPPFSVDCWRRVDSVQSLTRIHAASRPLMDGSTRLFLGYLLNIGFLGLLKRQIIKN